MVMELVEAEVDVNHMEEVSVTFYYCICTSAILHNLGLQGGLSALMLCCEEGNSEMAELLLASNADPNLQQSVCCVHSSSISNSIHYC